MQRVRKSICTSMKVKKKNRNPTITAEKTDSATSGTDNANTAERIVPNMPKNIPPAPHFIQVFAFEEHPVTADRMMTVNRNIIAVMSAVRAVTKVAVIIEFAKRIPPMIPRITPAIVPASIFEAFEQHEHSFDLHDI